MRSSSSSADLRPISGLPPVPRCVIILERLDIGIHGDKIDVAQPHVDHVVDRVAAASAGADYLDPRARVGVTHQLNHQRSSSTAYRQSLLLIAF